MTEAEARAAIIAEAISWELTPYHPPYARKKGVGVDCAQFPIAVFSACGHIPDLNPRYSAQWMQHRDEELYLDQIREWAKQISVKDAKAGDLVVWKFGRTYSHSAIVIDPPLVIHAWARARMVVRSDMAGEEELKNRPCVAFSVFK